MLLAGSLGEEGLGLLDGNGKDAVAAAPEDDGDGERDGGERDKDRSNGEARAETAEGARAGRRRAADPVEHDGAHETFASGAAGSTQRYWNARARGPISPAPTTDGHPSRCV